MSFFNWSILTLSVLVTLLGAVLCLLMWPFPGMAGDGPRFDDILLATELALVVSLVAAGARWLTDHRHPAMWAGEAALLLTVVAVLVYGLALY